RRLRVASHRLRDVVVLAVLVGVRLRLVAQGLGQVAGTTHRLAAGVVQPACAVPRVPACSGDVTQILAVLVDEPVGVAVVGERQNDMNAFDLGAHSAVLAYSLAEAAASAASRSSSSTASFQSWSTTASVVSFASAAMIRPAIVNARQRRRFSSSSAVILRC